MDAYITSIKDQKKSASSGDWYRDITKTVPTPEGLKIYSCQRRVIPNQKTASGAPKRETRKGSSRIDILVEEKVHD